MTDQPTGPIVYGDDIGYYKGGYTSLATTIPATQIRNAGEPVFPRLREWLRSVGADDLIPLIDAREAYGIAKYGQTLMTDDDRHTGTEIAGEATDELAYGMKAWMKRPDLGGLIQDAMLLSVQAAQAWMNAIELMDQEPWTQEELDRASEKVQEYKDLLGVKLLLPDCVVTKTVKDETEC
jgi:hypothetical protein